MKRIFFMLTLITATALSSMIMAEDAYTGLSDTNSPSIIDQYAEMQKSLVSDAFTNDPLFKNNTKAPKITYNLDLTSGYPQMKYKKNTNNYTITFITPGMDRKDISLTLKNNTLTVSGKSKLKSSLTDQSMSYDEDIVKQFSRTVSLPADSKLAEISSKYDNGVLTIIVPRDNKVDAENTKTISIE